MKVWTCEVCRLAHGAEYALPGDVRANLCPNCYHGFLRIFARAARRPVTRLPGLLDGWRLGPCGQEEELTDDGWKVKNGRQA